MLGAIVEEVGNFLGAVLGGLADGLSVHKSTHALASPVVKERVFLTALLNGFVFLGSHFLYGSVVGPAIAALVLEVTGHETGGAHGWRGCGFRRFFLFCFYFCLVIG
jgi:MFS family permease